MKWSKSILVSMATLAAGCAMESGDGGARTTSLVSSGCSVVAFGTLAAGDAFDGDAATLDGITGGTWEHLTPERTVTVCEPCVFPGRGEGVPEALRESWSERCGPRGNAQPPPFSERCTTTTERDVLIGSITSLSCSIDGGSVGNAAGTGTWNGEPGHTFTVDVLDDDDETTDFYSITIFDPSGTIIYAANGIPDSGDIAVVGL